MKKHLSLFLTLVVSLIILAHFFEYFPNGWDQTEYAWCLKANYLPHSPYIIFFFVGKFLHNFLDPAIALSTLSIMSGLGSISLLYFIVAKQTKHMFKKSGLPNNGTLSVATISTILLASSFVFIRQSTTQEVYSFQTLVILLSVFLATIPNKHGIILSAISSATAIGIHNSSLFVFPALLYVILLTNTKHRLRLTLLWLVLVVLVCSCFVFVVYLIMPVEGGSDKIVEVFKYLRGISYGLSLSSLFNIPFLLNSVGGFLSRLFFHDINAIMIRLPRATSPLGMNLLHLIGGSLGLVLSIKMNSRLAIFWLLYSAPFVIYEVLIGQNTDYGLYLPFILPSLFVFISVTCIFVARNILRRSKRYLAPVIWVPVILCFLYPSLYLIAKHWDDISKDAIKHYSSTTLGAIWISQNIQQNAIILQPVNEWNVNILPYYASRRHVIRSRGTLMIFNSLGPYTPMNINYYEYLTTEKLKNIMDSNIPVYAFEKDPLGTSNPKIINREYFKWKLAYTINADSVKSNISVSQKVRSQLPSGNIFLYRGEYIGR